MSLVSRPRLAALLTTLTVGAAGVTTWAYGHGNAQHPPASAASAGTLRPSVTGGTVLQVVAHPDDDLFFMNPDLSRSISTGVKVATVYLTSGESDGRNEAHSPHLQDPARPADHAAYAEARQNGIRAAYAQMATGDRTSAWQRTSVPTAAWGTPRWTSSSRGPRSTWCGCSCARPAASPATIRTASAACGTARCPPWVPS